LSNPWRLCRRPLITLSAVLILASGCKVGPEYVTPEAPVALSWLEDAAAPADAARGVESAVNAAWWTSFDDQVLTALVEEALGGNLSLQAAGLRVLEARARRAVVVGEYYPQSQTAEAGINSDRVSENTQGAFDNTQSAAFIGLQAMWELDFWGRFRRSIESADAALQASAADYDAVLVSLVSDVASSYILVRSLQERLEYARANVLAQRDTLELTQRRLEAGAVSELDVSTSQTTLSITEALIPDLEDLLRQATLSLCVLLGRTPSTLEAELGPSGLVPAPPPSIALGVPADLLRRRPDVRRAERIAAATSAQIGVATADLYPSISIAGSTGFAAAEFDLTGQSSELNNIFDADSFEGFIGLAVSWPIFNYGRIENNIRANDAVYEQAVALYRESVLRAAADVEASLSSFLRGRERVAHLESAVRASQRSLELSLIQYRNGAVDFIRVNLAQTDLTEQQDALAAAKADAAIGAVNTYRALGGGWEVRAGAPMIPDATIDAMRKRTDWGDVLEGAGGSDLGFDRPAERPK